MTVNQELPASARELMDKNVAQTIDETAQILRCSRTHVYDLMDSGELPSFKLGRRRLIPTDALRAMVEG